MKKYFLRFLGRCFILCGRTVVRFLPVASLKGSHFFRSLFFSLQTTTVIGSTPRFIVSAAKSCWRDAVENREVAVEKFLNQKAKTMTDFLDLGANVGYFSLIMGRRFPHLRVQSIEPDPGCRSHLRANVRFNQLKNVRSVAGVFSAKDESAVPFYCGADFLAESGSVEGGQGRRTMVPAYSIHGLVSRLPDSACVMIKIDVEGYEASALLGDVSAAVGKRVRAMVIEVHAFQHKYGFADYDAWWKRVNAWFPAQWQIVPPTLYYHPIRRYADRFLVREIPQPYDHARVQSEWTRLPWFHLLGERQV